MIHFLRYEIFYLGDNNFCFLTFLFVLINHLFKLFFTNNKMMPMLLFINTF